MKLLILTPFIRISGFFAFCSLLNHTIYGFKSVWLNTAFYIAAFDKAAKSMRKENASVSNCKVVALTNHGVGKTTTAVNLGVSLAQQSKKVLLIDSDAKCQIRHFASYAEKRVMPKEAKRDME